MVQIHRIIFIPVIFPRGAVLWRIWGTKKTFSQYFLLCWEPFWSILGLIFGVCSSILGKCSISSYEIWYRYFLYYSDIQGVIKNFAAHIPLLRALCSIVCLKKVKTFFWYFWVFLVDFVVCSPHSRQQSFIPYSLSFFFKINSGCGKWSRALWWALYYMYILICV